MSNAFSVWSLRTTCCARLHSVRISFRRSFRSVSSSRATSGDSRVRAHSLARSFRFPLSFPTRMSTLRSRTVSHLFTSSTGSPIRVDTVGISRHCFRQSDGSKSSSFSKQTSARTAPLNKNGLYFRRPSIVASPSLIRSYSLHHACPTAPASSRVLCKTNVISPFRCRRRRRKKSALINAAAESKQTAAFEDGQAGRRTRTQTEPAGRT